MEPETTTRDQAMDLAEESRQAEWTLPSFTAALFQGDLRWDLLHPFPVQDPDDAARGDEFVGRLVSVLDEHVDADEIDRTGAYPPEALAALAELGAFGMKIPAEHGGLGLSLSNYTRALVHIASHCQSTVTWLSAHQSIGVPQPLALFGTDAQRRAYLPRLARGEISAFALTEPDVGSDPARMRTTATPSADGSHYVLNGEKLWCTNVTADVLVVTARTPPKVVRGKEIPQLTCFIVERDAPGFAVTQHCSFMGLRGIANGTIRFDEVKVPADHVVGEPGDGLRIALTTLNTGRLSAAAAAVGAAKAALRWTEPWINERVQWGSPIGEHQSVAKMVATMASDTFAMEAITTYGAAAADHGQTDIRLEAAIAKYFCTETGWRVVDTLVQVRGGRGYETAPSLAARGEEPIPAERALRDARIGRILEGTSQVMQLLIAREAVDAHFKLVMPIMKPRPGQASRGRLAWDALRYYGRWYPGLWRRSRRALEAPHLSDRNREHLGFVEETSRKLARELFHTMARYRERLEKEQLLLADFVDVGADLFAMSASLAYAEHLVAADPDCGAQELADLFCRHARLRIGERFRDASKPDHRVYEDVTGALMDGRYRWLREGVHEPPTAPVDPARRDQAPAPPAPSPAARA